MDSVARKTVRILVVEDQDNWIKLYEKEFSAFSNENCTIEVCSVTNLVDALIQLSIETYHMITIDDQLLVGKTEEQRDYEGGRLSFTLSENRWFMTDSFALRSVLITQHERGSRFVKDILQKYDVQSYLQKGEEVAEELAEGGQLYGWFQEWKHKPVIEIITNSPDKFDTVHKLNIPIEQVLPFTPDPLQSTDNFPQLEMLPTISTEDLNRRKREELYILMHRLFPNARTIELTPIHAGRSATQVYRAIYYDASGTEYPEVIVKIGRADKVEQEYQNYSVYVSERIRNNRIRLSDKRYQRTQLLGGLVYTLLTGLQEFKDFYEETSLDDIQRIRRALHNLFEDTCDHWYQGGVQQRERQSLFELYDELFHISQPQYAQQVDDVIKALTEKGYVRFVDGEIEFTDLKDVATSFPNIINIMKSKPELRRTITTGLTHGDFNEQNIFVQPQTSQTTLIDFQHTGRHHAFRDFVRLEVVLKLYLLEVGTLREYYELEQLLMRDRRFDVPALNELRTAYRAKNPSETYLKAFETIVELRQLTNEKVHVIRNDYEEYFIGLMMANYATIRYLEENRRNKEHEEDPAYFDLRQQAALLSSSMIAARIELLY